MDFMGGSCQNGGMSARRARKDELIGSPPRAARRVGRGGRIGTSKQRVLTTRPALDGRHAPQRGADYLSQRGADYLQNDGAEEGRGREAWVNDEFNKAVGAG